jgi:hypothetical protein
MPLRSRSRLPPRADLRFGARGHLNAYTIEADRGAVMQSSNLEPRTMRYDITDDERQAAPALSW